MMNDEKLWFIIHRSSLIIFLCRGSVTAESPQHFVQVGSDANVVVQEVLQPHVVLAVGQGDERQEVPERHMHRRLLADRLILFEVRVDAEMSRHSWSSMKLPPPGEDRAAGEAPRRSLLFPPSASGAPRL